jgi:hypothetical protein
LTIVASLDLPGDSRSDEIAVQPVACSRCGFTGVAVYEESRRGSLDSEAWEHLGYELPNAVYDELLALVRGCPNPRDEACACEAHRSLSETDEGGRWVGLRTYPLARSFLMQLDEGRS